MSRLAQGEEMVMAVVIPFFSATSSSMATNGSVGGKAGAAAATKAMNAARDATSSGQGDGKGNGLASEPGAQAATAKNEEGKSSGGSSGEPFGGKSDKTTELLHEATQLLKSLKIQSPGPKLKVMQLGDVEHVQEGHVLLDSGATHGLRPARDEAEWNQAERTVVQLANGSTDSLRLKTGTRILLGHPSESTTRIIPMSALSDLDFSLEWRDGQCRLLDDQGRLVPVTLQNGCPMVDQTQGDKLLEWLEAYQVYQKKKLAVIRTLMSDAEMVDRSQLTMEMAVTLKIRQEFPDLPDPHPHQVGPLLGDDQSRNFRNSSALESTSTTTASTGQEHHHPSLFRTRPEVLGEAVQHGHHRSLVHRHLWQHSSQPP